MSLVPSTQETIEKGKYENEFEQEILTTLGDAASDMRLRLDHRVCTYDDNEIPHDNDHA